MADRTVSYPAPGSGDPYPDLPFTVRRIHHNGHDRIEPELDQDWDNPTKLQWTAAAAAAETGLHIRIREGGRTSPIGNQRRPTPGLYSIQIGATNISALNFHRSLDYLTGITIGAKEATRP